MFFGEYRHNVDAKGRLSIPAKMRNQCGESVVVTRGNEGCLALYTLEGWEKYYEELLALPQNKKSTRVFRRLVASRASECTFDKLGRINIPLTLRKEGCLEKECVIVGVIDHVEIWGQDVWDKFYEENSDQFDEVYDELGNIE